jgi:hypothetical protein
MQVKHLMFFYVFFIIFFLTNVGDAKENHSLSFSGKIESAFINYYQANHSVNSLQWNELEFYPWLKFTGKDTFSFTTEGILRKNLNYQGRSYYKAKDAYASISFNSIDVTLGKQIVSWGVTDEINPIDYFKTYDYTDLLRKEEEGVLALRAIYYLPKANFDFVWVPIFESHRISYDQENPWAGIPNQEVSFIINNNHKPARDIGSSQFGLRVGFQREGIDYSFTYIYGIDRFPTFIRMREIGLTESQPLVEISPWYQRIHLLGTDWNKSFSTWNLKGELVYVLTEDSQIEPYLKTILGIERNFSHLWSNTDLFALVQFIIDQGIEEEKGRGLSQNKIDYNHPFNYATTLNLDIKFSESYGLLVKGIFDIEEGGEILQSELRWKPRDSLVIYMGVDYISGKGGTYCGFFRDNDRFLTGIRFNF